MDFEFNRRMYLKFHENDDMIVRNNYYKCERCGQEKTVKCEPCIKPEGFQCACGDVRHFDTHKTYMKMPHPKTEMCPICLKVFPYAQFFQHTHFAEEREMERRILEATKEG